MNNEMTMSEYKKNPCSASSLPYWKTKEIVVPDNMMILHDKDFDAELLKQYSDECYFRLIHNFENLKPKNIPEGYSLCKMDISGFADHINECYEGMCISEKELQQYAKRKVYDSRLWLAVRDNGTGKIAASGIAELDKNIGEGILEWIQVSKAYRQKGLGTFIVNELLFRMKTVADFATVSGRCSNAANPESLYRKCGFTGNDIWHILKKR